MTTMIKYILILTIYIVAIKTQSGRWFRQIVRFDYLFHLDSNEIAQKMREYPSCKLIRYITRYLWGARKAYYSSLKKYPISYIFIDETNGQTCTSFYECRGSVKKLQNHAIYKLGIWDIGYNFLVGSDARLYEGRGWNRVRSFDPRWNEISYSIGNSKYSFN